MGYTLIEAKISASLSAHNAPRDDTDAALWNELMDEIERVVNRPRFQVFTVIDASLPRRHLSGYGLQGKHID